VTRRSRCFSYLLRVWQTSDGETRTWRASLERPGTEERQGFATLEELFEFLRQQALPLPEQGAAPAGEQTPGGESAGLRADPQKQERE
jgi:hypothetical protein